LSKRSSRGYRGYRYPVPIDGYDLIDVCFQIPDHPYYRAAVRGALHQLTYFYSWWNEESGANLAERWEVARIFLNLLYETLSVGEGCAVQLQVRQSFLDPCLLEYSPDGGDNWYTFANLLLCPAIAGDSYTMTLQLNLSQTSIYETLWDGTPISININAPAGTWDEGGDPDRDAALCMAAMSLVGSIAAQEAQALTMRYIGSALVFAALFILTGGFAAFGVLVVGTLIAGVSYTAAMDALQDRAALLAVACCMYEGLQGQAVTQVALANSLNACGFIGGSNEAIARDFIHRSLQADTTYYAMIDAAGRAWTQLTVLGLNLCECGDCGICTFDNPGSDLPYTVEYGEIAANGNPGQCSHALEWTSPPYSHGRRLTMVFELPALQTVHKVSWDCYHRVDSFPTGQLGQYVELLDEFQVPLANWSATIDTTKMVWFTSNLSGTPTSDVKYIRLNLQFVCDCPLPREIRADNIRVFCS